MKHRLSVQEYRTIDLTLFAVILAVSEYVITMAATRWYSGELYTVSVTAAVTAIVIMRWGTWAGIHAVLGGLVICAASGGTGLQFLIYCAGNLAGLGSVYLKRLMGAEKIRQDTLLTLLFALVTVLLMQAGRAAVAMILGTEPGRCVGFFTTDSLSGLFAMVIVYIVRKLDGVFEDQKIYLIRLQKENDKAKGGF